jgi:predicted dehydrogenase
MPTSTRREFLRRSALAAAGFGFASRAASALTAPAFLETPGSPNEKVNFGIIGTANRAEANIEGVQHHNFVAICDVDDHYLAALAQRAPHAEKYNDFRKLLDRRDIDAVVVSTPDHIHAPATVLALKSGRHVYCEKPLAHTIHEARVAAETAAKNKRATQMGTQIHAGANYRRVVELIRSGAIGAVREAHVWVGKTWSGGDRPKDASPVPPHLHWDLWLGPAPERPYHEEIYLPANWRRWWDFGGGTLADMGCHHMDVVHWALELRHPTHVEAEGPPVHAETTPAWLIARYAHPAKNGRGPVTGHVVRRRQTAAAVRGERSCAEAAGLGGRSALDRGKGMDAVGLRRLQAAAGGSIRWFYAAAAFDPGLDRPLRRMDPGHQDRQPTTCNFGYSGALSESVLLGNVAYRTGTKVEFDAEGCRITNSSQANALLQREYRKGWTL